MMSILRLFSDMRASAEEGVLLMMWDFACDSSFAGTS